MLDQITLLPVTTPYSDKAFCSRRLSLLLQEILPLFVFLTKLSQIMLCPPPFISAFPLLSPFPLLPPILSSPRSLQALASLNVAFSVV